MEKEKKTCSKEPHPSVNSTILMYKNMAHPIVKKDLNWS